MAQTLGNVGAPFACNGDFYQTRASNTATTLVRYPGIANGTSVYPGNVPVAINALSFNKGDGFLYGIQAATQQPVLYRLGSSGYEVVGTIVTAPAATPALTASFLPTGATQDAAGRYYFAGQSGANITPAAVYRVDSFADSDPGTAGVQILVAEIYNLAVGIVEPPLTLTPATVPNFGDFAFGSDGNLYGATNTNAFQLVLDDVANTATVNTRTIANVGGIGTAFVSNSDGLLYVFANATGTFSSVGVSLGANFVTSPTPTVASSSVVYIPPPAAAGSNSTDGAACLSTSDMVPAISNVPAVISPGQLVTGATLTCTNNGPDVALDATCAPSVPAGQGTVSNVVCTPAVPAASVAAGASITCTFDYTAPGVEGGVDEPVTGVTFLGATGAINDTIGATVSGISGGVCTTSPMQNNCTSAAAGVIDAVDDTATDPEGSTGSTNVAPNDQFPPGSTFTLGTGSTCAAATVSGAGVAGYTAPANGSTCTVVYRVCAAGAAGVPPEPCDTATLVVTGSPALTSDMSPAFGALPATVSPGQTVAGLTLTCTNAAAATAAATNASCAPSVPAGQGTVSNVVCTPVVPAASVAAGASIACTFDYTAPGVEGGVDEPVTGVTFLAATGATNDGVGGTVSGITGNVCTTSPTQNNCTSAAAGVIDAVDDTATEPEGSTGSTNVAPNDQFPPGSTFTLGTGSTCAAATVSGAGVAGYTAPTNGSTCTVVYRVCAAGAAGVPPEPCDTATLVVTGSPALTSDMSPAFGALPATVSPGQTVAGLTLTCTNAAAATAAATNASCAPSVPAGQGTVSNVVCTPVVPAASVAAGASIACTFDYTAPGVEGGVDEPVTGVTFLAATGATNDGVGGTVSGITGNVCTTSPTQNNCTSAAAGVIDAVDDTATDPEGSTGSTNVAPNDQFPPGSTFTLGTGSTCAAATVSGAGVAGYTAPTNGSTCTVVYRVCAAGAAGVPPEPCDTATLVVTGSPALTSDMSPAFGALPATVSPGQTVAGLTLTCTNAAAATAAATNASCAPSVPAGQGTVSNVVCTPVVPAASVAAGASIACTFDYTAPGVEGGVDEPVTGVTFLAATGATNDGVGGTVSGITGNVCTTSPTQNNCTSAAAGVIDAVDDTATEPEGSTGSTNVAPNDQFPPGSTFTLGTGSTCAAATVSGAGVAGYTAPANGSTCTVVYRVCAAGAAGVPPEPCDTATLVVTGSPALTSDMSPAFGALPATVSPGQTVAGLTLTCTNAAAATAAATNASCAPSVPAGQGTVSNVVCTPVVPAASVAAGASIACTFDYTAPGVEGGVDEPVTGVTFLAATGATNDGVGGTVSGITGNVCTTSPTQNNCTSAAAGVIDAVDDTATEPEGSTGSTNVAPNDQFPPGSMFTLGTGSTCAAATVSGAGVAGYTAPANGSTCTVVYRVCAAGAAGVPPEPCDTATLVVTGSPALTSDMSPAFGALPATVSPGQTVAGLTLTCTNAAAATAAATNASCAPSVPAGQGTVSNVVCTPVVPAASVAAGASIACTFDYTAPGVEGGVDEPVTGVTFLAATGATNDGVGGTVSGITGNVCTTSPTQNNCTSAAAGVIDAVDDTATDPEGSTGSTNVAPNDQFPPGSTFTLGTGSTCAAATVSGAGVAGYTAPTNGSTCTVVYRVCAAGAAGVPPEPCDTATLVVTGSPALTSDMSPAFGALPATVSPGQTVAGLTLTCTNAAAATAAATNASCAPSVPAGQGTVSNVVCTPVVPAASVAAGASIACTFDYTAPGVEGGVDEPVTGVTFLAATGATNDGVGGTVSGITGNVCTTSPTQNNCTSAAAGVIDAVDDTATDPEGSTGSTNVAPNDQFPPGSTFTLGTGSTCAAATVSGAGVAGYTAPANGSTCTVVYRVCAAGAAGVPPEPCDTATLVVTGSPVGATDMVSAVTCTPANPAPGATVNCTATCTNNGPNAATNAFCQFNNPAGLPGSPAPVCPNSPSASLPPASTLTCTVAFILPMAPGSVPVVVGTGAQNDTNGGLVPTAGNNGASVSLSAGIPATPIPVPTLAPTRVLLLALLLGLVGLAAVSRVRGSTRPG